MSGAARLGRSLPLVALAVAIAGPAASGAVRGGETRAPSAPAAFAATASTTTTISVAWKASRDNVRVAGYRLYRNGSRVAATAVRTYTFTGLRCGTRYALAVGAYDAAGNSSAKATTSASTRKCAAAKVDKQPPSAPFALAATAASPTSVSIAWNAASDNVGVTGYGLYADGAQVGKTEGTSHSFVGLKCGATTTFAVDAYDAAGNRSDRETLAASTLGCAAADTVAPTVPTGLATADTTDTSVSLSWKGSTDNRAVAGYGVYVSGTRAATTRSTAFTVSDLSCGTSSTFAVDAYDAVGNRSALATLTVSTRSCPGPDTKAPTAPTGLVRVTATVTTLQISWQAATDNVRVAAYDIYRNGELVAKTGGTIATLERLACGTTYTIAVDAYDRAGNHSPQTSVSAATRACSTGGANVFLSPVGSDAAGCTQIAPCASLARGYALAEPGDVVELAAGTYPAQTIPLDSSKTLVADVVFQPAAGDTVHLGGVSIAAHDVELRDVQVDGVETTATADDVTLRNLTSTDLSIVGTSNVNVIGGSYGPSTSADNAQIKPGCSGCAGPSHVLVDGATFYDSDFDCLHAWGTTYLTIRNSKFRNCDSYDVLVSGQGHPVQNLTLENNWGGTVLSGYSSFRVDAGTTGEGCTNVLYRNNSALDPMLVECATASGVSLVANVGPLSSLDCDSHLTYSRNVWNGTTCGATDVNAPSGFVDPLGFDLHLALGSAAIDHGDPADFPLTDIDGQARPNGAAPDAGADER